MKEDHSKEKVNDLKKQTIFFSQTDNILIQIYNLQPRDIAVTQFVTEKVFCIKK